MNVVVIGIIRNDPNKIKDMKRAGIWVDVDKAVIISLEEKEHHMNVVHPQPGKRMPKMPKSPQAFHSIVTSMIDHRLRLPGDTKEFSRSGSHHFSTELKHEHKLNNEKKHYFRTIMQEVRDVDEFVLFGPSTTKKELECQMRKDPLLHAHLMTVETADMMSDNQMIRWVENYFKQHEMSHKHRKSS